MRTERKLTVYTLADGTSITTRSALETRWAIFFNELGLKWHYEARKLTFNGGGWYTPDFLVEQLGFVEIKPTLDLLISESSKRIERAARNCTTKKIYCFVGERVSFDTVAMYEGKSIFAPTYVDMIRILFAIRHPAESSEFAEHRTFSAVVEMCMNRANRAKLDHFVNIGKVIELEAKEIIPA